MSKYLIPMILVVYGILLLKGVHLHKVTGSGEGWIFSGLFLVLVLLGFDYYESKNSKKEEKKKLTILDIVCMTIFWIGVTFMALYLFKISTNNYLMIIAILSTMYCGGTRFKKFKDIDNHHTQNKTTKD